MPQATGNFEAGHVQEYTANGAITANRLVKYHTTEGQVVACSAITDVAIGVSLNTVADGERVQVQTSGVAKVEASAAIATIGTEVMPTAAGAGKCVTSAGATANSIGVTEQAAGADGDIIRVRLATPNLKGPANA